MSKEVLHFKIGLSGSSDKKFPAFNILVNETNYVSKTLSSPANQIEYFEFDAEVSEGDCKLILEFTNKTAYDTILDSNGNIIDDLLLNIESIEIDEIDLGSLIWTASDYRPDYPKKYQYLKKEAGEELPESVSNCVNLGWNGKWILPFQSPFYIWLLQNI